MRRLADRTSLRVKLLVTMVSLVTLALAVMGLSSVLVMRHYLLARADQQLEQIAARTHERLVPGRDGTGDPSARDGGNILRVPSDSMVELRDATGKKIESSEVEGEDEGRLPAIPQDYAYLAAHMEETFTVASRSGETRWRVRIVALDGDRVLVAAVSLEGVGRIIGLLTWVDLALGGLVLLGMTGAAIVMVRASLRPLGDIEATARAIATGDLTRRAVDRPVSTEVGRLARAFNIMVSRIESEFRAREVSEAAARRSEQRMRTFVADAGHELRTPLTAIGGFAELYRTGAVDPDHMVGKVEAATERMRLLVEDLLLLARLDQERPPARLPVDLLAVVADAVQEGKVLAPDRELTFEVQDELVYEVCGDEARLRQVIANLLSNAFRHTPPGTPVMVRLREGRPGRAAVLEVADSGPGLNAEQAERVFERFYRVDQGRSRDDGGSGLGLAIVAALVRAHGGVAEVETGPGRGATFRISLPLAPE